MLRNKKRRDMIAYVYNIILLLLAILCNVFAQLSIKKLANANPFSKGLHAKTLTVLAFNTYFWSAIILYFIAFLISIIIYRKFPLSVITPVFMSLTFVLILIVSNIAFGESITIKKILGLLFTIIGITVLLL